MDLYYYLADPAELADGDAVSSFRRRLYAAFLAHAGVLPASFNREGANVGFHVMSQATTQGMVHVICNTSREEGKAEAPLVTTVGQVRLATRSRWPGRPGKYVALAGEFRDGAWRRLETVPLKGDPLHLPIDVDRATALILICRESNVAEWEAVLGHCHETCIR
jgi:hypothetical protein